LQACSSVSLMPVSPLVSIFLFKVFLRDGLLFFPDRQEGFLGTSAARARAPAISTSSLLHDFSPSLSAGTLIFLEFLVFFRFCVEIYLISPDNHSPLSFVLVRLLSLRRKAKSPFALSLLSRATNLVFPPFGLFLGLCLLSLSGHFLLPTRSGAGFVLKCPVKLLRGQAFIARAPFFLSAVFIFSLFFPVIAEFQASPLFVFLLRGPCPRSSPDPFKLVFSPSE